MIIEDEDDFELHQSQRNLALATIDELMLTKMDLLDAEKKVPRFINNALSYLKRKYVTEEQTISQLLISRREKQQN
ncbi:hypothetical protein [Leptospira kanakyensis]|uniref:Uncharacterized protein n=1 Tax=Leptospira kanakyensis TaxID=2484968 RepID=A0A6N4Q926_9LEPT|nr:hypothetical protein [Leptospira kanakyensis]MCW7469810.1 hypothetical protein [Leptospira kanakyensis]MCW7480791.1 hypothetical protein [Leptospira kanakyensis]TGK47598.1 hypothetical protein EHQ11_16845 [Leptospira kanakyensis]TGK63398.1 hypothetical protein EHQ16_02785 [Leptospira kanakyensis]TGK67002.1 hypothetical protein EHQ18_18020 [Leptospira kanakyensis]